MKLNTDLTFPSLPNFPAIRIEDITGIGSSMSIPISESVHHCNQAFQRHLDGMKLKIIMAPYYLSHTWDRVEFGWKACPRQLAGYLSDLWRQLGDIGKVIVVGWIVGLSLIISIIIYDYATIVSAEQVPPFTTQLLVPLADATTKSNSVQEDEFTSTSSSRTTFTAASGKTTASYSTYKTTDTGNSNSNQDRLPEHLQILSYLYPNGSFWPAHYITACKNAEMTMSRQEDDLALVTYDTPCSSNTRRSKAETIRQLKGKITLSRKAVERDLREGLVGYREGVVEMGDWKGIRWID